MAPVVAVVALGFQFLAQADSRIGLAPASAFSDHMVLQRSKRAPIWGSANPGDKVTVTFAGQTQKAIADRKGKWMARLAPMEASSESRELTIQSPSATITFKDVLVGDVWIAGGQSNMGRAANASWRPKGFNLHRPHIRFLKVVSPGSKYPKTELAPGKPNPRRPWVAKPNKWNVCENDMALHCCAVGFFFSDRVYEETGIPQGLLWNAVGGSVVREWIPRSGWWLRPELEKDAGVIDSWYPGTRTGRAAHTKAIEDIEAWCKLARDAVDKGHPFPFPQPKLPEPPDGGGRGRGTTILYNGRTHPLVPYAVKGILWYQGESDYANRQYRHMIEAMVESWRTLFACPDEEPVDLRYYFVQMQRCGSYMSPGVRDFQYQSYFSIPNAGMAVLLDLDVNLHPMNKYDAGRRLALWSLSRDYGKDIPFSGPVYKSHRTEGNEVIVSFDHTHGGLFIGRKEKLDPVEKLPQGKLVNLEITADGRNWFPAMSKLDGECLVAWSDGLNSPIDVRYCWKSIAEEPFLYNRENLPAGQFNTHTLRAVLKRGEQ